MSAKNLLLSIVITGLLFTARSGEYARSADSFVEAIGVCTHARYSNTQYGRYDSVSTLLADIGIRYIRDGASTRDSEEGGVFSWFRDIYLQHGIKTTLVFHWKDGLLHAWPTDAPVIIKKYGMINATAAVEGPNEPDIFGCGYPDPNGDVWSNVKIFMQDMKDALRNDSQTRNIPIISPAMANPDADVWFNNEWRIAPMPYVDYEGSHLYHANNPPTLAWCAIWRANRVVGDSFPTKPVVVTETGYSTATNDYNNRGLSSKAAAKYTARLLANFYNAGIVRTHLYQLLDMGGGIDEYENTLGLARDDFV